MNWPVVWWIEDFSGMFDGKMRGVTLREGPVSKMSGQTHGLEVSLDELCLAFGCGAAGAVDTSACVCCLFATASAAAWAMLVCAASSRAPWRTVLSSVCDPPGSMANKNCRWNDVKLCNGNRCFGGTFVTRFIAARLAFFCPSPFGDGATSFIKLMVGLERLAWSVGVEYAHCGNCGAPGASVEMFESTPGSTCSFCRSAGATAYDL